MPSVGMRRSTRVFGTRVLRSGRRLWTEPRKGGKNVRATNSENKLHDLLDNSADVGGDINHPHREFWQEDENSASLDMSAEPKVEELELVGVEEKHQDKKHGIVYKRKRKRADIRTTRLTEDRYVKKFVRKEWRTRCRAIKSYRTSGVVRDSVRTRELAIVVNESSYDCYYQITCLLSSLLSYMARVRVRVRQLSAFMLSKPMLNAYSSCGIFFLKDSITPLKPCACIVSGSGSVMPLFSVNIFAIPSFFSHIQTSMFLRYAYLDCLFVKHCENNQEVINVDDDDVEEHGCTYEASGMPTRSDVSCSKVVASDNDTSRGRQSGQSPVGYHKSALRSLQLRNSRNIQKRRSSLRCKRGRPPASFRSQKAKGVLASELFRIRQDGTQFPATSPGFSLRDKRISTTNTQEVKSGVVTQDVCVSSCSANLLITDSDKCYRLEGANIALELSSSKQWLLSVTKGGTKKYSLVAQKVMRPFSSNRFTHAVLWAGDGSLKLEFTDKQDWFIFKELYKICYERNVQSPTASVIPVPGVLEVASPVDQYVPFVRPESYITLKNDELMRALMKKSANYDMDSDDEEWLANLSNDLYVENELEEVITPENFELVIDSLERGVHCNPDELIDEQTACELCMHLERKEVVKAIYEYWTRKRKLKRTPLVRVFQLYQPRRSQAIPKSILRKKRSFKRKASQGGRGKQRLLLKARATERNAPKQDNNVHKLQEVKAAANKYGGLATLKRERAQMLMENADLATYKAMMALRIADEAAAQVDE